MGPVDLPCLHAMQEYGYLMCLILSLANLGVQGLPKGPFKCCPSCAAAGSSCPLHSVCVDFNFSLTHLARVASADVRLLPPNQLHFLPQSSYAALINDSGSAAADAEAERACSDFNAARVLARTSDKVSQNAYCCGLSAICLLVPCSHVSGTPSCILVRHFSTGHNRSSLSCPSYETLSFPAPTCHAV